MHLERAYCVWSILWLYTARIKLSMVTCNDIADSLLSLTRLFADDSSLFYSASSLDDIQGLINHDLILLSQWAKQWLVTFNPSKTEAILFTLRNFDHMPVLKLRNTHIKFVESHKHYHTMAN